MFLKAVRAGHVSIYECQRVVIRDLDTDDNIPPGDSPDSWRIIDIESDRGLITLNILIDEVMKGNLKIFLMNDKGETIDRIYG
jgi:hypothetical protein